RARRDVPRALLRDVQRRDRPAHRAGDPRDAGGARDGGAGLARARGAPARERSRRGAAAQAPRGGRPSPLVGLQQARPAARRGRRLHACAPAVRGDRPGAGVMPVRAHDRFGAEITLRPDDVAEYARRAGDGNPIHHDPAYAAGTRFGRPIASGAQTTGLLMGLTATHFSRDSAMLGLDFWFRFRRPVFADETVRLEWLVVAVRPTPRLGGDVVELRGRLRNA